MKKLILLVGQSNMSGRGYLTENDVTELPGITALRWDKVWIPAIDPFNYDRINQLGLNNSQDPFEEKALDINNQRRCGVGPGRIFAKLLQEKFSDTEIGLIPASVGGTPIAAWLPGGIDKYSDRHPYDDALTMARYAMQSGNIEVILWHQGESDAKFKTPDYKEKLITVINNFRRDLSLENVPVILGEIGYFLDEQHFSGKEYNEYIRQATAELPLAGCVSAKGLTDRGDGVHFDTPSQYELGRRYFQEYCRLTEQQNAPAGNNASSKSPDDAKATVQFDCDFPGGNVRFFDFDSKNGIVKLDSDFRDSAEDQFWTYFRVRGAAGRKLVFKFTGAGPFKRARVSRPGMAYTLDEGKSWNWTSPEKDNADYWSFSFDFPQNANTARFATTIPYLEDDLNARLAKHPNLQRTILTQSRKGRNVPLVTIGPEDAKLVFASTARHHAIEAPANWVMEGMMEAAAAETPEGKWIRSNLRCIFVPFMDFDGVEDGDPGKNRQPHDHNRDYIAELYPEVKAFKSLIRCETTSKHLVYFDMHSPQVRGTDEHPAHDNFFTMGPPPEMEHYWNDYRMALIEATKLDPIRFFGAWDQKWGERFNVPAKNPGEMKSNHWVLTQPNILWVANWEFGYGRCGGLVSREALRGLGRRMMNILANQFAARY